MKQPVRPFKNTLKLLILILTISLASCSGLIEEAVDAAAPKEIEDKNKTNFDALTCESQGGTVENVCMQNQLFCIQSYSDAGKTCTDSSECLGDCRVEGQFIEANTETSGFCSADNNPCGCFQAVEAGIAEYAICVD
ncbi:hypothetical protein [Reinekea sp.]|jgi:hypothetical protein|uniref:hypothetical protein n=1 Tax=Reinekea sp. TaxID=1970455 RepID=UPI00398A0037